jgi:hypothetical protein
VEISEDKLEDIAQAVPVGSPEEFDVDDCLMILEHAWEGKPITPASSRSDSTKMWEDEMLT